MTTEARLASSIRSDRRAGARSVRPCRKLDPRRMARNPVMFVVEVGSVARHGPLLQGPRRRSTQENVFAGLVALWLWFTVLFANFAEAMAEGRGKAQADDAAQDPRRRRWRARGGADGTIEEVPSAQLAVGDVVVVSAGEVIPGDGDVIEGIASVDESAITGESAPVIRESGGDRSAVTGGTRVLSDEIVVRVTAKPGETFLDRMIALVEGASRQKTPNEIALDILLAGLTIIFLVAVVTLQPFADLLRRRAVDDRARRAARLPDPDDDRRAPLRDRHRRHGPARAAQRARDVAAAPSRRPATARRCCSTRPARSRSATARPTEFLPAPGRHRARARRRGAALEPRRRDARGPLDRRAREGALRPARARAPRRDARPVHRADRDERRRHRTAAAIRKGAADAVRRWVEEQGGAVPAELGASRRRRSPRRAARRSSSPRTAARSASSTSRTSSRRACASASTSCARWASAR